MKKLLFLAATLLITLVSCQKEETPQVIEQQQITVTIPSQDLTRAEDGDGKSVNRCILQVYKRDGENQVPYGEKYYAQVKDFKATFNLQLLTSQTYDFVFWADCVESTEGDAIKTDKNYNTADLRDITVNNYAGNNESFDAFTAVYKDFEVIGAFNISDVELIRPLGQVSVTTNDLSAIPDDKYKPDYVKVIFTDLPDSYNALTEEVSSNADAAEVSYTAAVKSTTGLLTVDYLFAGAKESSIADFKIEFYKGDPAGADATLLTSNSNFKNIPLRRNYQTKISGNLLTSSGQVEVTVTPGFVGEYNYITIGNNVYKMVDNGSDLLSSISEGENVYLTQSISLPATTISAPAGLPGNSIIELNNNELTLTTSGNFWGIAVQADQTLTIKNGTVKANNYAGGNTMSAAVLSGGTLILENVKYYASRTAIGVQYSSTSGSLTIKDSYIEAFYFPLGTNASAPASSNVSVTIENSTLKSTSTVASAVLWNVPSALNAVNTTFISQGYQGVVIRGGEATFTDCTISQDFKGTDADSWNAQYDTETEYWGGGNNVNGAALVLGNKDLSGSTSYRYPTTVTLNNTQVTTTGSGSLFPALYAYANQTEGNGVTLTYDSKTSFTGGTVEIGSKNVIVNGNEFTKAGAVQEVKDKAGFLQVLNSNAAATDTQVQITLTNDITLSATDFQDNLDGDNYGRMHVKEGQSVSIDLGGNQLTMNTRINTYSNSSLSISNGVINDVRDESTKLGVSNAVLIAAQSGTSGSTINLDNVKMTTNASGVGVFGDNVTVNMTDCVITAERSYSDGGYSKKEDYAVATNAATDITVYMNLERCTLTAVNPVCFNVNGKLTMKDCIINGEYQGVIVRAGEAEITDCTITQNYTESDAAAASSYQRGDSGISWGSSPQQPYAALTLGNRTNNNNVYPHPVTVKITNSTIQTAGANKALFPAIYAWGQNAERPVTLTYDSNSAANMKGDVVIGANVKVNEEAVTASTAGETTYVDYAW